jgi:pyrroloquinoline-quinone synthase
MLRGYDYISEDTLRYFQFRLSEAPEDATFALNYAKEHAITPETQALVLNALRFKCGLLWAQLDALQHVYVNGHAGPGAWQPGVGMVAGAN